MEKCKYVYTQMHIEGVSDRKVEVPMFEGVIQPNSDLSIFLIN